MIKHLAFILALANGATLIVSTHAIAADAIVQSAVDAAEKSLKARIGVAVHDTANGRTWYHRADERFPMASTSKAFTCAALLSKGRDVLAKSVTISESDLQAYAPVTKGMIGKKATASELCDITMRTSDNTAINKVLEMLGGPSAVTAFVRHAGDQVSRFDRDEPSLNDGTPGDPRDTTTPRASVETLGTLVLGDALDAEARSQLTKWLKSNEVGGPLLRAGIPSNWQIADRTGAGGFGTRGVIAVIWPPQRKPVVVAVYLTETQASMDARNTAIASIGAAIAESIR